MLLTYHCSLFVTFTALYLLVTIRRGFILCGRMYLAAGGDLCRLISLNIVGVLLPALQWGSILTWKLIYVNPIVSVVLIDQIIIASSYYCQHFHKSRCCIHSSLSVWWWRHANIVLKDFHAGIPLYSKTLYRLPTISSYDARTAALSQAFSCYNRLSSLNHERLSPLSSSFLELLHSQTIYGTCNL